MQLSDFCKTILFIFILASINLKNGEAQSTRYWSIQLNEESSLLAGAVVGGGAGVGAIYFNPAQISANTKSNLSINANLLSLGFNRVGNALGDDINLKHTRFLAEPRLFSYILNAKKVEGLTYEFIAMGKENFLVNFSSATDTQMDILTLLPGEERYNANFKYRNHYLEYWLGAGASYQLKNGLSFGVSMFGMIKSLYYNNQLSINANPLSDTIDNGIDQIPFYIASTVSNNYVKFEDYRLLWKIGLVYETKQFSFGINITTPSLHLFSGGKVVSSAQMQSNIMNPDGSGLLPNYYISDEQIKNDIKLNYKDPLSIALGIKYTLPSDKHNLYATIEFFFGLDPYRFLIATVNPNASIPSSFQTLTPKDWLSYVSGARPVTNIAIGYKAVLKKDLLILTGFKTDFSYMNKLKFTGYEEYKNLADFEYNVYHITGGLLYSFLGHKLFTGIQYSIGNMKDMKQLVNLSDPVEYNEIEQAALQGVRMNSMNYKYDGLSLFLGVTFNFGNNSQNKAPDEVSSLY